MRINIEHSLLKLVVCVKTFIITFTHSTSKIRLLILRSNKPIPPFSMKLKSVILRNNYSHISLQIFNCTQRKITQCYASKSVITPNNSHVHFKLLFFLDMHLSLCTSEKCTLSYITDHNHSQNTVGLLILIVAILWPTKQ